MKSASRFLVSIWLAGMAACSRDVVRIDIDVGTNQPPKLLASIDQQVADLQSRGVYFEFVKLKCPPNSYLNQADPRLEIFEPSSNGGESPAPAGYSATRDSYRSDGNGGLEPRTYYTVRMFSVALDAAGTITHDGYSDCPLNLSLPDGGSPTICFGSTDDDYSPPVCPASRPWGLCEVSDAYCR